MPALAPVVDRLEDVAEPARQFYTAKDGKFHVDLSGAPAGFVPATELALANGKVVEFRDTNIALKKQVDEFAPKLAKFDGLDPEAAKAALAAQDALKKKGVTSADDLTTLMTTTVNNAVAPLMDQIKAITQSAQDAKNRADIMTLRETLAAKFVKAGGVPDALEFIVGKANGIFTVDGGAVKAAANQFSTDRPGEALGVDEWITRLTKEAAFAFKPSSGGGAPPTSGNSAPGRPAGQLVIKDPTAQQLGEHAKEIREGKMRVEYST